MEDKAPFRPNLGFHRRDFPETSLVALSTHALHTVYNFCIRSVIKGTVLGEQSPFRLYLGFLSMKHEPQPVPNASQPDIFISSLVFQGHALVFF